MGRAGDRRVGLALLAAALLGAGGWWAATSSPSGGVGGDAGGPTRGTLGRPAAASPSADAASPRFLAPRAIGQQDGALADPLLNADVRDTLEALLNEALEAGEVTGAAELKRRLQPLVARHFAAEVKDRALALAMRYVDYRAALGRVPPPADMNDPNAVRAAMQARDTVRQQFFEPAEYDALFASEAALDNHTLARLEIAADATRTPEQRAQALQAAEDALPDGLRAARRATALHLAVADQTAAFDAQGADAGTRYAERSARYGSTAAQALAQLDSEQRDWQQRLDQYQRARSASGEGASLQRLRQQLFSPQEQLRLDAALALRASGG